jgi:hypothetical protein
LIEHHKAEEKAAWSRKYILYLQSLEWKERRQRVLRREQRLPRPRPEPCWNCSAVHLRRGRMSAAYRGPGRGAP